MTLDWCGMFPASTGVFQKNCFALPIELLSFTGKNNDDVNELYWNTATEVNNNYFTIEKSQDGEIFELVDVISGAGNSSQEINYSLNDNNPYEGTSYYRLKQTDYDEKYSYSDIIAIKKENKTKLVIYPNPSNNAILISNFGKSLSSSSLKVYDTQGRLVLNRILEEETDYKLDISTLVNGLYFIKMINNQNTFTESFIKE